MFELCWNITAKCNMGCKYCHRFLNLDNLSKEENFQILQNIIDAGIKNVTWTGGEALLIPYLPELLKTAHEAGIKNKMITNGILLTDETLEKISPYMDLITFSLDSTDAQINEKLGRGADHFVRIADRIDAVQKYSHIKIKINSVLTKINKEDLYKLGEYMKSKGLDSWRIFKFLPIRELSLTNREMFDISQEEYDEVLSKLKKDFPELGAEQRTMNEFQAFYLLILANGDFVITKNNKDIKIGSALKDSMKDVLLKKAQAA